MNIGIELTKLQIENLKNGASKFIIPISDYDLNRIKLGYSIGDSLPIYHTDKNKFFFIQEDFYQNENIYYKVDGWGDHLLYQNASEMKEEQSRFNFKTCIDAKIIKIQDLTYLDFCLLIPYVSDTVYFDYLEVYYNNLMEELKLKRNYKDNDYILLIHFYKDVKWKKN